jgi:hypothetical protein
VIQKYEILWYAEALEEMDLFYIRFDWDASKKFNESQFLNIPLNPN